MVGASFVMVSQIVVADFMTKLKHLGNRPKSNEKTAGYIFICLEHFRLANLQNIAVTLQNLFIKNPHIF
jgi:hypothetical protein